MSHHSVSPPDNAQAPDLWKGLDRPLYCFGEKQAYPDECRYCSDLQIQERVEISSDLYSGSLKDLCYLAFHAISSEFSHDTDFFRDRIDSDGVCSFCDHLRLKLWGRISNIKVQLDPLPEIEARQSICGLCSLVAKTAARLKRHRDIYQIRLQTKRYGSFSLHFRSQYMTIYEIEMDSKKLGSDQARILLEAELFIPDTINWERVRAPLLEAAVAPEPLDPHPTGFRLIDVEKCCVVKAPRTCEYVALSYVWGEARLNRKFLHLSLSNSQDLEVEYSLQGIGIPATVQDAMAACRGLGKRYLWVDRFCIPQDESNNPIKNAQINAMDRIYSHAVVALVPLEGNSDYGLPGVSKLKCKARYRTQFSGREFWETNTNANGFFGDKVQLSKWSSRGWTFQEGTCSPNLLFFTDDGLVGEYSGTRVFFESETPTAVSIPNYDFRHQNFNDRFGFFQFGAHEVSRREFGKDSDILNAFTGVLNALFEGHRFGLPMKGFDDALRWKGERPSERRESTNENNFPSWSWASVRSNIHWVTSESVPLATFGFLEADRSDTPCLDPCWPRNMGFHHSSQDILGAAIAWQTGCVETPLPELIQSTSSPQLFGAFVQEFKRSYPTFMSLWKAMRGIEPNDLPLQNFRDKFSAAQIEAAMKPGRLLASSQVTTSSAVLKSVYDPSSPDLPFGVIQIFFGESNVGYADLDTEQIVKRQVLVDETMLGKGRWPAISNPQDMRSNIDRCDVYFLALTICSLWGHSGESPSAITDRFTFDDTCCPFLNLYVTALAIETNSGISRRLGLAYFPLDNWLELPRQFKAVVLE